MKERPFALIGVNVRDRLPRVRRYFDENDLQWRSFFMGDDETTTNQYKVDAFPTMVTIDHNGVISHRGNQFDLEVVRKLVANAESM